MEHNQSKYLQRDRLMRLKPTDLKELPALQETVMMWGIEEAGAIKPPLIPGDRRFTLRRAKSERFWAQK